jgi:hypothetical protein
VRSTLHQFSGMWDVDELQIGIAPILLGAGLRLFEQLGDIAIRLEKVRLVDSGPRIDIWYRIVK